MAEFLTYGPGIPRYLALWIPLTPLLLLALRSAGAGWGTLAVGLATTIPTLVLHDPSEELALVPAARVALVAGSLAVALAWLVVRLMRPGPSEPAQDSGWESDHLGGHRRTAVRWGWVAVVAVFALAVRVPLAWLDPGIGDFATASEVAARQLLAGTNPYDAANPFTTIGAYQYPSGSLLWHLPLVAAGPAELWGEAHLGARAALWTTDLLGIALLAWAGARVGHARAGLLAAAAYAVHPTLVRESGILVANDVILGALVTAAAVAFTLKRPLVAATAAGLAVSVKPAAIVVLPVVLLLGGPAAAVVMAALPVALQAPFLLWPSPGLRGLGAIAEPAARLAEEEVLRLTVWLPLYEVTAPTEDLVQALSILGILAALLAGWWAGTRVRRQGADVGRVAAAVALPLVVAYALAPRWPTNFQDWYLAPMVLALVFSGAGGSPAREAEIDREAVHLPSAAPSGQAGDGRG